MKHAALVFVLFLVVASFSGCVSVPGSKPGQRSLSAQYDDAGIKTGIASALLQKDPVKANSVNVHCFHGHIFLIGEAEAGFREFAVETARKAEGAVHVTTHWFADGTSSLAADTAIEAAIDAELLFTKGLPSTQVTVDVWGAHVVLTGTLDTQQNVNRAITAAKGVKGVKSVTSYLALP